jgi:hypoxanthine phosphoribosyltransferase
MEKQKVDYETIDFLSRALAFRFKLNGRKFSHVIGISKCLMYGVSSYNGEKATGEMMITQDINFDELPDNSRILVVDDKCDTGSTIDHIKSRISDRFEYVRYATIFAEKRATKKVDHYGVVLPDHTWLDFPWE